MSKPTPFELFAAFAAQFPLLTREDLELTVAQMRESPGWERALLHARRQARAIGIAEEDIGESRPTEDLSFGAILLLPA